MNQQTQQWLEAAKILAADHEAKVPCPSCGRGVLRVIDVEIPNKQGFFDRYLSCPECNERMVLSAVRKAGGMDGNVS
jgi:transcription elongation factor Elf1